MQQTEIQRTKNRDKTTKSKISKKEEKRDVTTRTRIRTTSSSRIPHDITMNEDDDDEAMAPPMPPPTTTTGDAVSAKAAASKELLLLLNESKSTGEEEKFLNSLNTERNRSETITEQCFHKLSKRGGCSESIAKITEIMQLEKDFRKKYHGNRIMYKNWFWLHEDEKTDLVPIY